jgi:hypothetical protein
MSSLYDIILGRNSSQIGIFDSNFRRVNSTGVVTSLQSSETSRIPIHPVEDGNPISDHATFNPTEVTVRIDFSSGEYNPAYQELKRMHDSKEFLQVVTRPETFRDMVIDTLSVAEDAYFVDTVSIDLKLRQVKTVRPQYSTATGPNANKNNNKKQKTINSKKLTGQKKIVKPPVKNGEKQGTPATTEQKTQGSLLSKIFSQNKKNMGF